MENQAPSAFPPDVRLRHSSHHQWNTMADPTPTASLNYTNGNINATAANSSVIDYEKDMEKEIFGRLYKFCVPLLILFCFISILVNVRILVSVYWIRRPLSPTLHISLSLAGADAFTSFTLGLGLAVNSLLEHALGIQTDPCFTLALEAMRLGGILVTVAHLLALAGNHYLGILRPLHYLSIMTHRNTTACIVFLWTVPILFFFGYFSLVYGQGFQTRECKGDFLVKIKFRAVFSSLFFAPLILMFIIYTHIFSIVRRHQAARQRFSRLSTSSRQQHLQAAALNNGGCGGTSNQQQQFARNVKAIYTTLFILGSFIMGWMPALFMFMLVCDDCAYKFDNTVFRLWLYIFCNFLIILKTLLNPIIYAARMQEIKTATKRMYGHLRRSCCPCLELGQQNGDSDFATGCGMSSEASHHHMHRMSQFNSSTRSGTIICRIPSCPSKRQSAVPTTNGSVRNNAEQGLLQRSSTRGHPKRRDTTAVL